jgi:hypothetical protein
MKKLKNKLTLTHGNKGTDEGTSEMNSDTDEYGDEQNDEIYPLKD